ncbi:MAG: DUF5615 family PIN-like protein [Phycisphaerae bacterium]|nr:DUF5615 family PIN-like protein [Phycisphaerae bacterium]
MKVLLDHCVPRPFAKLLPGHEVRTTRFMGWEDLSNGKLLAAAAKQFDIFVTTDQSVAKQQNLALLPLPVIVLKGFTNKLEDLVVLVPELQSLLGQALQARVYHVPRTDRPRPD